MKPKSEIKVSVHQRQSKVHLSDSRIKTLVRSIFEAEKIKTHIEVGISFIRNKEMIKLHQEYLHDTSPTDVMAFPMDALKAHSKKCCLGDVVVCVDAANEVALQYGQPIKKEIALYVIHGILHLLGWRDKSLRDRNKMMKRQEALLKKYFKGL